MPHTDANYSTMVESVVKAAKKIEAEVPLSSDQAIAIDLAITAMIVLVDIASSFNRIARALEQSGTNVDKKPQQDTEKPKFPTV